MLLIFLILALWAFSLATIPKESSPNIEFGIINISTVYVGASPEDIDQLITSKIEQEIKDLEWIDKIESTSALSSSTISITLTNDASTTEVVTDINDSLERVNFPSDAEDPVVTEIATDTKQMFDVLLYGPSETTSAQLLKQRARSLQSQLEWKGRISTIDIDGTSDYDVIVQIDKQKVESIGLSLSSVAQTIRSYVTRLPLWNFAIDETTYDYRFAKAVDDEQWLSNIPIITTNGAYVLLRDIATIKREFDDERVVRMGRFQETGYSYVRMTFNKKDGENIFSSAAAAKEVFEKQIQSTMYNDISSTYVRDTAEFIKEDYASLANNMLITLILVFLSVLLFVGIKESVIATLSLPLAFSITFLVLKLTGRTLNFMTNFSMIVTLGIAIDTIIVVMEWAAENMKLGYNPFSSVLLAVRDYKLPLIAGTSTTVIVFIPLFSLPGVTGKFLAYIPITIFITLIAALFISLTINPAIYYLTSKKKNYYRKNEQEEAYLDAEEKIVLEEERKNKIEKTWSEWDRRHRIFDRMGERYQHFLEWFLKSKRNRWLTIILPIIALFVSFGTLAPAIWFKFFPAGDNPNLFIDVIAPVGSSKETLSEHIKEIEEALSEIPEWKVYYMTIQEKPQAQIAISLELFDKDERDKQWMRDSFAVEKELEEKLLYLRSQWLTVESRVESGGPPGGKAIGIKLIAENIKSFDAVRKVSKDFEQFLKEQAGTKNVSNSAQETPGQFIFDFDKAALQLLSLSPWALISEISSAVIGTNAWSIAGEFDDHDIKVRYEQIDDSLTPQQMENIIINTSVGPVRIGDIASYTLASNIDKIQREDGKIVISVESDMERWMTPTATQAAYVNFAKNYQYPSGVSFEAWGENNENSDIIVATGVSFVLALIMIYAILVLQFNSLKQPIFIMYTVILALLGTNIGLFLTGNPYSMAFGIWFIALTGIVVNDAIVFIDRINRNRKRGMDIYTAITEAGKSRLQPIILTTITTVLWLMSIVREDEFFAWLAYTIMFGLFVGSLMTLFVIPAIYYQFVKEKS